MKKSKVPSGYDTVIGKNSLFEGNIKSSGSIRIDGEVTGDIVVEGDVLLGKTGTVSGSIKAVNVHLSGFVKGNVTSTGILRILSSTKLLGDIAVKSFVADEGAIFQGKCKMLEFNNEESNNRKPKSSFRRTKPTLKDKKDDLVQDEIAAAEEKEDI